VIVEPHALNAIAHPFHAVPVAAMRRGDDLIVDFEADLPAFGVGERHAAAGAMTAARQRDDGVSWHNPSPAMRARIDRAAEVRSRGIPVCRPSQDVVSLLTNSCTKELGR